MNDTMKLEHLDRLVRAQAEAQTKIVGAMKDLTDGARMLSEAVIAVNARTGNHAEVLDHTLKLVENLARVVETLEKRLAEVEGALETMKEANRP